MLSLYKKPIISLFIVLFFKLFILSMIPLTGDEAYFIKWGNNLDLGYYDHPPVVGWLIYLMSFINDSFIFFRLFSFFTVLVVAFIIYKIATLYEVEKEKAFFLSLIFLISPIDILIVLFTNDIPLLLFGTIGTYFLLCSFEKEGWLKYSILSGLFLGLAFLSKYFVVFLMLSLVVFIFIQYRTKAIKNFLVVTGVVVLFILENLYYNYTNCWNNIIFNFIARPEETTFDLSNTLNYFYTILYFITPWGLFYLVKGREFYKGKLLTLVVSILTLIFFIFLVVSFKKSIGLHWFLVFLPYIFLLFSFVNIKYYNKIFYLNFTFTIIHIGILVTLIFIDKKDILSPVRYNEFNFFDKTDEICEVIKDIDDIYSVSYTRSSLLAYHCKKDVKMLFNTVKYGREDDKLVDVRALDKKDITFFNLSMIEKPEINKVCTNFDMQEKKTENLSFYLGTCKNFDYEKYKEVVLEKLRESYYDIPSWLPCKECYFTDRYFK